MNLKRNINDLCKSKDFSIIFASTDDSRWLSILFSRTQDKGRSFNFGELTSNSKPRFIIVRQTVELLPASINNCNVLTDSNYNYAKNSLVYSHTDSPRKGPLFALKGVINQLFNTGNKVFVDIKSILRHHLFYRRGSPNMAAFLAYN